MSPNIFFALQVPGVHLQHHEEQLGFQNAAHIRWVPHQSKSQNRNAPAWQSFPAFVK